MVNLCDVRWAKGGIYSSGTKESPIQFYLEALSNSTSFDLLLGYFSSAAINVVALGFAKFVSSGGKMRLVINDVLSEQDKNAIISAQSIDLANPPIDFSNISQLKRVLNDYGRHFFECLSWLIAKERIDIKIIRPKTGNGIAHYKTGIFKDEHNNRVGFTGSCNFTANGFLSNLEDVTSFLSWDNGNSIDWIEAKANHFDNIFTGNADFIEYVDAGNVKVAIREEFGNGTTDISELLIKEHELLKRKKEEFDKPELKKVIQKVEEHIEKIILEPKFPYSEGPREYQLEAYSKWRDNGKKGIFAMATGTGKTLTSLNCLLKEYKEYGTYKAVIVVPTIALVTQWAKECKAFNFRNVITVSSKEPWPADIALLNTAQHWIDTSFVVIVTYASFYRQNFQNHFKELPNNTLLIADEVHNMGAPKLLRLLKTIHLQKRIGLSATPDRAYDQVGNGAIENFFNDKPPFVYSYSMEQAINKGWLCKYKYYPHVVYLTSIELDEYAKISKELMNYFDVKTKKYKECPQVEALLQSRKRIIHKASAKKGIFNRILKEEFLRRGHLKYTLIYVPEGIEADYVNETDYTRSDELSESEDDISLIREYTQAVREADKSILVRQYTAKTPNREQIIDEFKRGDTHVLTSMKCLDEGVDVPRSELAIFCASTGNPRQFIQRRGRVLRLHEDKKFAVIHDLVVVPDIENDGGTSFEMERNLVKKELERVVNFAFLAMNKMETFEVLSEVLEKYNINLFDLHHKMNQYEFNKRR